MYLTVKVQLKSPGVYQVSPAGSLDSNTSEALQNRVDSLLAESPQMIIFNMKDLDYISSAGVRVVIRTRIGLEKVSGKLVFMNLKPQIQKVFDIIKALPSMQIFESTRELDRYLDSMQKIAREDDN